MNRLLHPIVVLVPFLFVSCVQEGQQEAESPGMEADASAALLADALSASYPSHAAGAKVVDWDGNTLQEGDNGYTCMPTPPPLKERGLVSPMCLDDVWLAWADAWQNRTPFSTDRVGIAYMLSGDGGASNIDPFAEGPTDDNEWIDEGPHIMILSPDPSLTDNIPTDPSYGGPYVMWKGTEYEHVMVPVKAGAVMDVAGAVEDALSAADTNMQAAVGVMDWEGNVLKEGSSGYTCLPTPPQTGPGRAPMCFDEQWMAWGNAWMNKQPFSTSSVALAYMLAGDVGASNTDPFAEGSTEDNDWVMEAPHLMLIAPKAEMLGGITTDFNKGGPYVMWKGTPYEHVMIPIAQRQ